MKVCQACKTEGVENYCSTCGKPQVIPRINGNYLLAEFRSVMSLEKGFFLTIYKLATRPGKNIKGFLHYDRNRLIKPIVFLIVTSLLYSVANSFFHFEDGYAAAIENGESATVSIAKWVQENYGYANTIMAVFIAAWVRLFFRKHVVNIFEILVLLCYVMGMGMLVFTVLGILACLIAFPFIQVASLVALIYLTWTIGQFYGRMKIINYIKAFTAYILGFLTFSATGYIIGVVVDFLTNNSG